MQKRAFTLIELLVVIAIVGLLATLTMISISSARAKSRDAQRKNDLVQIGKALQMYYADKEDYPASGYSDTADIAVKLTPSYIKKLPHDPMHPNGTSGDYSYTYVDKTNYKIAANLERAVNGNNVYEATPGGVSVISPTPTIGPLSATYTVPPGDFSGGNLNITATFNKTPTSVTWTITDAYSGNVVINPPSTGFGESGKIEGVCGLSGSGLTSIISCSGQAGGNWFLAMRAVYGSESVNDTWNWGN